MSEQWWRTPSYDTPLATLYGQQAAKLTYFQVKKHLHLPYMLKSTSDRHFVSSRNAALDASKEMMKAYQDLRNGKNAIAFLCDTMDFQVFSAAIVVIINLLSHSSVSISHEQAEDWKLVSDTTSILEHVSDVMDSVIPYFGRVRISQTPDKLVTRQTESSASTSVSSLPESLHTPPTEVQFSLNPFLSFDSLSSMDVLSDEELHVDWTTLLDGTIDYEFNQVFGIPEAYGTSSR